MLAICTLEREIFMSVIKTLFTYSKIRTAGLTLLLLEVEQFY